MYIIFSTSGVYFITLSCTHLYECTCMYVCVCLQDYAPQRKARISLDIDLTGPILLIPKHAFSPELMGGDIGHVRVTNTTR